MKRTLDFNEGSEEPPPAKVPCQRDLYCDSMAASSSSFPSSFSISSTSQRKYDVFLSFRGEDTRNTLVDFLNYALQRRGISIFKDDEKLEGGKAIKPELLKAIEESRFAVVILSEYYASSTWCLDELVKIVDCRKEKGMTVLPIFYNVDPSDVRKQTGTFAKAFDEHEKQLKEKVGTYRDALKHVADIAGHHQDKNRPLSEAVKWIVGRLSHISSFEFSQITEGLVGIDSRLVELESCLAFKDDVRFIGIWAMGGMGKTTLASVVYRMVSKEFEASCFIDEVRKKDELSLQEALITQISLEKILIKNKYDGADMIKKILWDRKVLLVLDDVDDLKKLEMLVRKSDRFGSGSRIIITTRDKHLLKEFKLDEVEIFEVKALNYGEAHSLFYSKAFKKEQCPDEYFELSKSFLEYGNGLPLALEVLGSFLIEKSTAEWKSALEMLKEDPGPKINQVLKISLDGLPDPVMDIFKDIACLFNHEEKDHVVGMLDSIGRHSRIGLCILSDKSLLKMSKNNELWMHNLVEDMGRNMVRQESLEPGERSRLWLFEDIVHVMINNTGGGNVQAMDIRGAEARSKKQKSPLWNPNAFSKMSNLKFLRVRNVSPQYVPEHLPNSLKYLEWSGAKSLPSLQSYELVQLHLQHSGLQSYELVQLHLQHSKIVFFWNGMNIFGNLKCMSIESSKLFTSPNFNVTQNLEDLVLARCSNLRSLHPSIGKLQKLKLLNLKGCQKLTGLPDKFEMESLVTLDLTHCLKVKRIPEFVGNIELLQELLLEGTAITELPSFECLTGLNTLNLQKCKNLVRLPNTICSLPSLNNLNLFGCAKFDKLPGDLGNIVSLKKLGLRKTAIKELPSSFEFLIGLTSLDLKDCKNFVLLPSTICSLKSLDEIILSGCSKFDKLPKDLGNITSLKKLDLSGTAIKELPSSVEFLKSLDEIILTGCSKFDKLPKDLGNITSLKKLDLSGTAIKELPSSVEFLIGLTSLDLRYCEEFVLLPSTVCSLKSLDEIVLSGCSKFDKLPKDLGNIISLKKLDLSGTAIKELPSSVEFLIGLTLLDLRYCEEFVLLPSTVCSLKSLKTMNLSRCPKFVNLPDNFGNLKHLYSLQLEGTAIEVLPSSVGRLAALIYLELKDCKNLVCLPSTICNLKSVRYLNLTRCSKIANLPENLGNMESLQVLRLGGTAIKELPSSTIHLKGVEIVSFKGCQLSSSSLTSMPRSHTIDFRDCNLSAIPSGIDRFSRTELLNLVLMGNDFVSLPESISQFSKLARLFLQGCKSLRSLSNIPSRVDFICLDNCTSLERLPEPPNDFNSICRKFTVRCFNCFKLAYNIQTFSNIFQGQSSQQFEKCYIIPGWEIPKWFEKVNICDTSVVPLYHLGTTSYKIIKKVKIKLPVPGSGSWCDVWRGIVLCVVFLPTDRHHRPRYQQDHYIGVEGCELTGSVFPDTCPTFKSKYGKVDSHHLWLHSLSKNNFRFPKTPGCFIDKKGFHQVELEIQTKGLEVEKIGFRVV